jgi:hypothetical protein
MDSLEPKLPAVRSIAWLGLGEAKRAHIANENIALLWQLGGPSLPNYGECPRWSGIGVIEKCGGDLFDSPCDNELPPLVIRESDGLESCALGVRHQLFCTVTGNFYCRIRIAHVGVRREQDLHAVSRGGNDTCVGSYSPRRRDINLTWNENSAQGLGRRIFRNSGGYVNRQKGRNEDET